MQKLFLDTNIVLDFLGEREQFYFSAAKIMTLADYKKIKVFVSPMSFANTYYILSKYENKTLALEKLRKFKLLCSVTVVNEHIIEKALHSGFYDLEDALQYFSAITAKCDVIITRNERDFKNSLIPVMNAENYLSSLW